MAGGGASQTGEHDTQTTEATQEECQLDTGVEELVRGGGGEGGGGEGGRSG